MRIGIDFIDLFPKTNQGINVYSENLIEGFLKLSEKFTLQLYVNDSYYKYAKKKFKSKKIDIFVYKHKNKKIKNLILKSIVFFNSLTSIKFNKLYYIFKNLFFNDLKILIENNSDILICPNVILNHYNYNIKTILCIHDIQHEYLKENFSKNQLSERKITRGLSVDKCDKLIASSKYLKKQCFKYLKKNLSDINVIEEGINLGLFKRKQYKNKLIKKYYLPEKYLFYPAAFWPHKNHLFLLNAIKGFSKHKINLILCGLKKNFYQEVSDYILKNNLKNVKYIGDLSKNELIKVYKYSTVVIIPSLEESSCLLLKEGIGFKKPLICSDTETFKEKNKIFKINLYKKKNLNDLRNKIRNIYINKKIVQKDLNKNYKLLKNYDWKSVAKNYFNLCYKLNI